ncbi:hypothetical protein ASPWEDRAFT_26426 [Aspergillus wentii DTO 134E9]|uniref:UBZ4-type domain-containing protein n=1 Tax=Aspergillus wentii DTO 134E9 TaxID=1073089 RepID=A0A1L9RQA2_ASPWE|nr:uncharacterized protein ASPWEDRAFT_26426 [Aspergillus wentii DTO 134E9]KAI9923870.1 hypothetical protein MW887_008175 [Aspergillus wentii]OJJ36998.1 hypothetical protein ASPWEDRAFT_26426 [Aspergillus wentii DTO 134E9]
MPRVPTTNQVIVGAPVNIVLKADQPTGRTVAGTIATVLTRGNHPRGIKVRLTDGRVGRVQSMASGNAGSVTNTAAAVPAARTTAEPGLPSQHIGLDAYMTRGKQRQNGRGGRGKTGPVGGEEEQVSTQSSAAVTCPVCGEFNGDEAAVAHHVAGHFGD